jgi:hypothetical protein
LTGFVNNKNKRRHCPARPGNPIFLGTKKTGRAQEASDDGIAKEWKFRSDESQRGNSRRDARDDATASRIQIVNTSLKLFAARYRGNDAYSRARIFLVSN